MTGPGDNWRFHMDGTARGSAWLGDQDAIEPMCREAAPAVLDRDNLLSQAAVGLVSAIDRTESRGAHARDDHPGRDGAGRPKQTPAFRQDDGVRLADRPVHLGPLSNQAASIPPGKRVY